MSSDKVPLCEADFREWFPSIISFSFSLFPLRVKVLNFYDPFPVSLTLSFLTASNLGKLSFLPAIRLGFNSVFLLDFL